MGVAPFHRWLKSLLDEQPRGGARRLAEEIGTTPSNISRWCAGSEPEQKWLPKLAEATSTPLEDITEMISVARRAKRLGDITDLGDLASLRMQAAAAESDRHLLENMLAAATDRVAMARRILEEAEAAEAAAADALSEAQRVAGERRRGAARSRPSDPAPG